MSADSVLDVEGLEVSYRTEAGEFAALSDVSLSVAPGEIVGIVGESGCGKSSLSLALLGLLPNNGRISAGRITMDDRNVLELTPDGLRALRGPYVSTVFQDPIGSLNPTFRVGTQMVEAQAAHGRQGASRAELRARAISAMTRVGIPDAAHRIDNYPHEFSGGMRQRAMIAMALLLEPAILIADEPTTALDVTLEAQIIELLRELREEKNTAIVFISHDLAVIAQICDRVVVMYAGQVVEDGDVFSVLETPRHPYTRALLGASPDRRKHHSRLATIPGIVPSLAALPPGCRFANRCRHRQDVCGTLEPELLDGVRCHMYAPPPGTSWPATAGTPQADAAASPESGPARIDGDDALVVIHDLDVVYTRGRNRLLRRAGTELRAVDGVSLELRRGEVMGLVGESGSGKTTLGETLVGLTRPAAGQVVFDGEDVFALDRSGMRAFRKRAQIIFQDAYSSLSPRKRVESLLVEPYQINHTPRHERMPVDELLAMVGLQAEHAQKFPHELSGGQARRVGIARALALRPELVVADEPTAGLDVSAAAAVLNLMRDLRDQHGLTYLIITHNLNLVATIADDIAVMYLGQIVEVGPSETILGSPAHPYSQALLAAVPDLDPRARRRHEMLLDGDLPSASDPPSGCRFHTRCPYADERSRREAPELELVDGGANGHAVACHHWRRIAASRIEANAEHDWPALS